MSKEKTLGNFRKEKPLFVDNKGVGRKFSFVSPSGNLSLDWGATTLGCGLTELSVNSDLECLVIETDGGHKLSPEKLEVMLRQLLREAVFLSHEKIVEKSLPVPESSLESNLRRFLSTKWVWQINELEENEYFIQTIYNSPNNPFVPRSATKTKVNLKVFFKVPKSEYESFVRGTAKESTRVETMKKYLSEISKTVKFVVPIQSIETDD